MMTDAPTHTLQLPIEPLFILHTLQANGWEASLVGGAVRDLLLEKNHAGQDALDEATSDLPKTQPIDFDLTTNATPEQILAIFPESFYENTFGTVSIAAKHLHEMMGIAEETLSVEKATTAKNTLINLPTATKIHESLTVGQSADIQLPASANPHLHSKNFEITTYRSESEYTDHRRPESVTWGKTIEEDLSRRDFTMNAMAIQVDKKFLDELFAKFAKDAADTDAAAQKSAAHLEFVDLPPSAYTIIDLFHGLADLKNHTINTVGDPAQRFEEDALRMLRSIRFSVQLNLKMSDEIFTAISALASDIQHISGERIRDEFLKMLASPYPAEAIELLEETGLLHEILPEVREGKNVQQGGHHTTDVWTHSIDALRCCPSKDPIVRFATLLHDVAKPRTFRINDGKITFYNHEIIGARMARSIAQRFRLSKAETDRIFLLVRYHMFHYQPYHTDSAIRRFMRNVGLENINDILDLREADRLGSGARETSWRLEEMKDRMVEQLHQPFAITDLAIDGNDLMSELGLKPGPVIGKILHTLFEQVLENPDLNEKAKLLELAKLELEKENI